MHWRLSISPNWCGWPFEFQASTQKSALRILHASQLPVCVCWFLYFLAEYECTRTHTLNISSFNAKICSLRASRLTASCLRVCVLIYDCRDMHTHTYTRTFCGKNLRVCVCVCVCVQGTSEFTSSCIRMSNAHRQPNAATYARFQIITHFQTQGCFFFCVVCVCTHPSSCSKKNWKRVEHSGRFELLFRKIVHLDAVFFAQAREYIE